MPDEQQLSAPKLDLDFGVSFPLEGVIEAVFRYAEIHRSTMSEKNRDRFDAIGAQIIEDSYAVWRAAWVKAGVLKNA